MSICNNILDNFLKDLQLVPALNLDVYRLKDNI